MCSSNDFLTAYLSLELSSLALYILASFKKTSSYSIESGLKYFIIGAISSAFFLLGSSFIYLYSGSVHFDDFKTLYESDMFFFDEEFAKECPIYFDLLFNPILDMSLIYHNDYLKLINEGSLTTSDILRGTFDFSFIEIGLALIIFSMCIKLAAAPFHLWSLDVYEGSPTSSSFFFAAITKLSIFVLLIRICFFNFHSAFVHWQFYFFWIGVISVFVGSFGGLKQRRLKTLLAYSSITNMGYALLALGTATVIGIQMLFFHIVIYMISGLCTWSILIFLRLKNKKLSNKYNKELSDLALLRKSNPALAFAFSLTMFSIAGIPPMVGFLAKMGIFLSVINIYFYIFAAASAVFSVIATVYYIRVIKVIYFENLLVGKLYYPINSSNTILLSFLIFLLLILFINPSILFIWGHKLIPVAKFSVI
jgi:NADH-quinone oxidoreductase subunit N